MSVQESADVAGQEKGNNPTRGEYEMTEVDGFEKLVDRMKGASSVEDWSHILSDYISWGNNKIADTVAIFNMNSATDCPNAKTREEGESETGLCQVPWQECYAHKAEYMYNEPLPYRRRQSFLWDCLDPDTWAKAFLAIVDRKIRYGTLESRSDVDIRFSEAGDFRHDGDIVRVNQIAQILSEHGIQVYTYSASHKLDWSKANHFTVNQSNSLADYGDRLFTVAPEDSDLSEDMVICPYDKTDGEIECGDCRLCINPEGPDVGIRPH